MKQTIPCFLIPLEFNQTTLIEWILRWYNRKNYPSGNHELVFEFMFHESDCHYKLRKAADGLVPGKNGNLSWDKATFFPYGPNITVNITIKEP